MTVVRFDPQEQNTLDGIKMCFQDLLNRAEKGEIKSFAFVTVDTDNVAQYSTRNLNSILALIGAVETLKIELIDELEYS